MPGIDQYTVLMLHCNGDDESTTFIDDSPSEHTVTAYNNAQIDTAQSKFGGASGLFNGSTDRLQLSDSDDWNFGSGEFTLDFWVKLSTGVTTIPQTFISQWGSGGNDASWLLMKHTPGRLTFYYSTNGSSQVAIESTYDFSDTNWHHIAVVRDGNTLRFFVDGVAKGTGDLTGVTFYNSSRNLNISTFQDGSQTPVYGWMDEIRISKGIARWTSGFSVPTEEYVGNETIEISEDLTLADILEAIENPQTLVISEDLTLNDEVIPIAGNLEIEVNENLTVDESLSVEENPQTISISEDIELSDSESLGTNEPVYYASKIIEGDSLIFVTYTSPAKLVHIDISDPENPIKTVYELTGATYAVDVYKNSTNDYYYVICEDGKIVKVEITDLDNQTIISTGETDNLEGGALLASYLQTFASTDNTDGEIIMIDERDVEKINTDLRWLQTITNQIPTRLDWILGKLINTDLRWLATQTKTINTDLRWLASDYDEIVLTPLNYTDWVVKINGTSLTALNDIDMNSIQIVHDINAEEPKGSIATFTLHRRFDKLNYDNQGNSSQITNNNTVVIEIKGIGEFSGKVANLIANSEEETVLVTAIGTRPSDRRQTISIPLASVNENLHLYHALISNINIDNPYIDPTEEAPQYYKGIQVDLGTQIEQQILRYSALLDSATLASEVISGDFTPKQNWTYFWLAKFSHLILGLTQGTLRYIGTSLGSLSTDAWKINGLSYHYQKEQTDIETELGTYSLGSAPYNVISVKNGRKITKDRWEDRNDGLYLVKDASYDYEQYAKDVAALEYRKIQNINGDVLPITSADITLSLDAYYYYGIKLLTRLNITNTTTSDIYNNANGFPIAVKTITIRCATEGENSMSVLLNCDNQKSQVELDEIDALYPDEDSEEYVQSEDARLIHRKFDPNTWGYTG